MTNKERYYEMNIISLNDKYFSIELFGIKEWQKTLDEILKVIPFDLSIKYDDCWNYHGDELPPYSELEEDELYLFLNENGTVIKDKPLVWNFKDVNALSNIICGFINADRNIIAKVNKPLNCLNVFFEEEENNDKIIDFWAENSDYFLSTLIDYSGLILVSKSKEKIDKLEELIKSKTNIKNLKKLKGKRIIL